MGLLVLRMNVFVVGCQGQGRSSAPTVTTRVTRQCVCLCVGTRPVCVQ